ncbi:bifunctional serine/threonine-protein kinase/formylglycine-generating enzyme family protein [Nodularia sp. UHCC 0506]|uniref:bifunctional serine/threonine-protein kinase/formylglycine-generating enzyme family protein n=1 Tax=Nodularia sp. UHCC 0506 TaxID=3110243 RepID=UPI002B2074AF|nr:bifunctional serine/threonine-protein kinase/formylglycine-generating enzyme family protein [Nodularia sp. UHCC 0506]MEA5513518.1 bifunctional serine/threonine-protein kinase/formylglycine-generating enzyme family protein [Nodularia sp. UHCC 0506]
MQICQNPNCSNPFNPEGNMFCMSCGQNNFGKYLRNRYRVLRLLGEGGFSRTYATEDADRLNAPCVIKQFFPQVQGTIQRNKAAEFFREEAFRLYELGENHTQIPRLLAYFEQGSSLYLVQEFIEGKTLLQEVQKQAFTEKQIYQLLTDLLPVLQFVHGAKVIHRDIKPENIIRRDSDGKPVLIDFGGAKQVTQTTLARQATVIYTIGYAPSEQMAGFPCHGSDLYALGVTCVRLLTQCLPLQNAYGEINDPLYDAMNGNWLWQKELEKKGITISDELSQILNKLLKHLASERYQTAAEVINDLKSINETQLELENTEFSLPKLIRLPPLPKKVKPPLPPLETFKFEVVTVDTAGRVVNRDYPTAKFFAEKLSQTVTLEMVSIPGGSFMMGSPEFEGEADERPQHKVILQPFFMGKYPITQAQWKAVAALPEVKQRLNTHPSKFKGSNLPVESVSWDEAVEFCARLSAKTGREYRLPSESEWEYACRASTTTSFHFGEMISTDLVNCSRKQTTDVGSFKIANAFGLYDMHGLVWEWCADTWHNNYLDAPSDGSAWEIDGELYRRLLRGGSWRYSAELCRSASRSWDESDGGLRNPGFRVVFSAVS